MKTAKDVGGDFYDFFEIDDNRLLFLIADVSGKGIPAALFMMRAKTLIKTLAETKELTIDMIITAVNDELSSNNDAKMFVTCWAGILYINEGILHYVNAGHNPPLLKRRNGKYQYLNMKKNFVLGGLPDFIYQKEEIKLNKGDSILIYTDGVTEASNSNKELFGEDRLIKSLREINGSSVKTVIEHVNNEIDLFVGNNPQFDDITMLVFDYSKKESKWEK